jgi:hypothetical protein
MKPAFSCILAGLLFASSLSSATPLVGPTRTHTTIASALAVASPGDLILVDPVATPYPPFTLTRLPMAHVPDSFSNLVSLHSTVEGGSA